MDRCALFVDASYLLADGALAVHGTRHGESVSWDYEGLLRLLSGLATERTGLPLLRCYWYEATADGCRTAEHEALADLPGIKLRLAKSRPGRREAVEIEIHRDLTTLARNAAISDALVVSAEEDLAQAIADVQDLGMRITLTHVATGGDRTVSRALRQESDDIIEIGAEQLRPYVELTAGAEAAGPDEPGDADRAPARTQANGHSATAGVGTYPQLPSAPASQAPPGAYTSPAAGDYQRPAQLSRAPGREERPREDRPRGDRPAQAANGEAPPARQDSYAAPGVPGLPEASGPPGAEAAQTLPGQLRRLPSRAGSPGPMGPYSGPQPVVTSPSPPGASGSGYQSAGSGTGVSLTDAVQAAHEEGQEFGASVARDAPALWLEAVLARKPRMPSDLEARLLQGSALPIDFLLHDEVRHALRRGFWDALERTRR